MIGRRKFLLGASAVPGAALMPEGGPSDKNAADKRAWLQHKRWGGFAAYTGALGYADRHSVVPGERFNLMVSTGPEGTPTKGKIEIYRIGHYPARQPPDRQLAWSVADVVVAQRPIPASAASLGAGWPVSIVDIDTTGWRPGYHTVDFIDAHGGRRDRDIAFIVVGGRDRNADVLVWLSTNTYQAYNEWGGASLYRSAFTGTPAQMVSFNRPTPPEFFRYEYFIVRWIEQLAAKQKLKLDYTTNFDIYSDPRQAESCRLLISGSHNEYWSMEEFDAIYRRIFERGRNTIFLGADTAYWQARYGDLDRAKDGVDRGRQLVCYKSPDDPIVRRVGPREARLLVTDLFRAGGRRPETMLVGVAYQSYFPAGSPVRYPYRVVRNDLPFFAGTGYEIGDKIADVVGYEWDNTDPDGDGRRLWNDSSLIAPLDPNRIKVIFAGEALDINHRPGRAEAAYFVSPAGAKVFASGSTRWAWGLGKRGFERAKFKTLNTNLVTYFLDQTKAMHAAGH